MKKTAKKNGWLAILAMALVFGTGVPVMAQTLTEPDVSGYFVNVNEQRTGPYDTYGLRQLMDQGHLTRDSLVWKEGMVGWVLAGTVQELAFLFSSETPPPLPPQTPVSSISNDGYEDFSSGQRWGTWALNAFTVPGLGSYIIMGDRRGGTVQLVTGTVGWVCNIIGWPGVINAFNEKADEDNSVYRKRTTFIVVGSIGFLSSGFNFIYNIVRSARYHRPQPQTAALFDPEAWSIVVPPGRDGIEQVSLSYTMRF